MDTDKQHHQTCQIVLPTGSGRKVGRMKGHPVPVARIYDLKPETSCQKSSAARKMERLKQRILQIVPGKAKGAAHDPFADRLARLR